MNKKSQKTFNGPAILAAMFRELDPAFRKKLLIKLEKASPLIAKVIGELEFIYQDIPRLNDNSIQKILAIIPEKDWLLAWKLSNKYIKKILLKNMSDRKREIFLKEANNQPRVLKKQVIRIQMNIAHQILKLLEKGELKLKSRRFI